MGRVLQAFLAAGFLAGLPPAGAQVTWSPNDPRLCPAWLQEPAVAPAAYWRVERLSESTYRLSSWPDVPGGLNGTMEYDAASGTVIRLSGDLCKVEGRSKENLSMPSSEPRQRAIANAFATFSEGERAARAGKIAEAGNATTAACEGFRNGGARIAVSICEVRRAVRARESGRYGETLELARGAADALAIRAGEDHVDTLAARQVQAQAYSLLSKPEEGLALARDVGKRRAALLGAEHVDTIASRNTEAVCLRQLERNSEAISVYEEILGILVRTRGVRDPETLRVKNNLANGYLAVARPEAAAVLFTEVLDARREISGPRHPDTLNSASNLVLAARQAGDPVRAIRLAEGAIPDFLAVFGSRHPATIRLQRRLADANVSVGRAELAVPIYEALVPLLTEQLGARHADTIEMRHWLAAARIYSDDPARALKELSALNEDLETHLGHDHTWSMRTRGVLAYAMLHAGHPSDAARLLEGDTAPGALDRGSAGPVTIETFQRYAGIAQARFEAGDRTDALRRMEEIAALKRARLGDGHPQTLDTLATLADFHVRVGNEAKAVSILEELVLQTESRFGTGLTVGDAQFAALSSRVGAEFQSAGYTTLAWLLARSDPVRALRIAELAKARGLAESVGADIRLHSIDAARRTQLRQLSGRLAEAENALLKAAPGSEAQLQGLAQSSNLREEISESLPKENEGDRLGDIALPKDVAVVSYLLSQDRAIAFVVLGKQAVRAIDLGEAPGLAETVAAWRQMMSSADAASERVWRLGDGRYVVSLSRPAADAVRVGSPEEIGQALAKRFLPPLSKLPPSTRRLIVSPDGPLAFVPFDALPWNGRPLVERFAISYVPSLTVLGSLERRARDRAVAPGGTDFLGIGIKSYSASSKWSPLPAAESEVLAIAGGFGNRSRTLLGDEARGATLKRLSESGELERFRYVHLATHAFLSERNAKLSAVVMADDELSAAEWTALRLRAELVVLSACETGLGRARTAEGVVGLPYAMIASGASAAVLTLWRVADRGAEKFMVAFYGRLRAGRPPAAALRETKLEFARSKGPWSAPRHWAPYVLYGAS